MGAAVRHRKLPRTDLGSWLIILGYVIVVVSVVNIVRELVTRSAGQKAIAELSVPPQGFIPYLDPAWAMNSDGEQAGSVFAEVHSAASSANLPSVAPWEAQTSEIREVIGATTDVDGSALESWLPEYLAIPAIDLDVPIVKTDYEEVEVQGDVYRQWLAPDSRVAGWQPSSASLGVKGNTVLLGHHNVYGEVFRDLEQLEIGDRVWIYSGERSYQYRVSLKIILPERYEPIDTRLENARWIQPTQDERLTLVTCWPYETNTYRLILVAEPIGGGGKDQRWENQDFDP